jgi:hypothetical protein
VLGAARVYGKGMRVREESDLIREWNDGPPRDR